MKAFAENANTLVESSESIIKFRRVKTGEAISVVICVGKSAPLIGVAFAALHPLFQALKADGDLKKLLKQTSDTIGRLASELQKLTNKLKDIQPDASDLEVMETLFKMVEDGLIKVQNVIQERNSGVWSRFRSLGDHKRALDDWNAAVKIMLDDQDRHRLNMVYYHTKLIQKMSMLQILLLSLQLSLTLFLLITLHEIKNAILHPEAHFLAKWIQSFFHGCDVLIKRAKIAEKIEEYLTHFGVTDVRS